MLGGVLVELTILLAATRQQTTQVLNDAAAVYKKVDTNAIVVKVKQEFTAKDKAKTAKKAAPKPSA